MAVRDKLAVAEVDGELEDVARQVSPAIVEVEESVDTLGGVAFVLAEQVPDVGRVPEHPRGRRSAVMDGDETHAPRAGLHAPDRAAPPGRGAVGAPRRSLWGGAGPPV